MSKILSRAIIRNIFNIICLMVIITAVVLSLGSASGTDGFIAQITGSTTTKAATPPEVSTNNASDITSTAATLNGNLTLLGTATVVNVSFEYGPTTSYGSTVAGVPSSLDSSGSFTADLTGLFPGQTYHFRAKVEGDGTVYGSDQSFTTFLATPVVDTGTASNITSNGAKISGNLADKGSADSVTVSFEYGPTTSYGSMVAGVPAALDSAGSFTANLTGLTLGKTYHFRAKAVGAGTVYGSDQSFTTLSATTVILPEATTDSASDITANSATLEGNLSNLGSNSNVLVSFEWGTTTAYGNTSMIRLFTKEGNFSAELTNLTADTTYHFRAKAVGSETVYGSDQSFKTLSPAPVVATGKASNIASTGATVSGSLTSKGSADSVAVSFEYGTTTGYGSTVAGVPAALTSAGTFIVNLTGLTPGRTYHFRTKAVGDSTVYGSDATFTTTGTSPEGNPPVVITNNASGITDTSATLNGNLSDPGSASSVSVSFEYGTTTSYGSAAAGVPATRTSAGAFTANLTGLTPGQTYHFRAKAVGDGTVYGSNATFTTAGTPPDVTPPEVTTNSASGITTTSATLNGNFSDLGSDSSVTVSFEYGTTTGYGSTVAGVPAALTSAGAFTANLTGLTSGQTYHFRAKTVGDRTVYGSDATFTTAPGSTTESDWPLIAGITGGTTVVGLIVLFIFRRNVF